MRLIIFTTDQDRSLPSLLSAAKRYKIQTKVIDYSTLSFRNGKIWSDESKLTLSTTDKIFLRWPWYALDTKKDYNFYAKYIVDAYPEKIILDRVCLTDFSPFYEDKLFQALLFEKLNIPTPRTYHFTSKDMIDMSLFSFPLVMKRRISSRGKGTYRISSVSDFRKRVQQVNVNDFIFQEYIPFQYDLRLLFYKGELLGTIERTPHVRANNRLAVKGGKVFQLKKKKVITDCLSYVSYLGADFVGFDVLVGEDDRYYVIEANLSPQYNKFEEITGAAVSDQIIKDTLS